MPRLQEGREALLGAGDDFRQRAKKEFDTFADFAVRDSVLEVAVGLMDVARPPFSCTHLLTSSRIAAAFKNVVDAFVTGIVLPPISLLPFIDRNLDEKFAVIRGGGPDRLNNDYSTAQQAVDDGAIVLTYGVFINNILNFVGIAISLFLIARIYGRLTHDNVIKRQVRCPFCRKWISEKAKRCVNCTSWLDGREQ